jgi:hypothetical protein
MPMIIVLTATTAAPSANHPRAGITARAAGGGVGAVMALSDHSRTAAALRMQKLTRRPIPLAGLTTRSKYWKVN